MKGKYVYSLLQPRCERLTCERVKKVQRASSRDELWGVFPVDQFKNVIEAINVNVSKESMNRERSLGVYISQNFQLSHH